MQRRETSHKKSILIVLLLVVVAVAVLVKLRYKNTATETSAPKGTSKAIIKNEVIKPKLTRLIAAGDFIAHDALNAAAKTNDGAYSYAAFMDQMKPVLATADIRFCNQATLVGGESFGVSGYPAFNAPKAFAEDMAGVGCNVINTASNHSSDKTQAVIDANVATWQKIQGTLTVAGQNSSEEGKQKVHYFEVDGMKYAFLAYTTYSNATPPTTYGVNMYSRDFASRQIEEAKAAGATFILVSMRWGTEYSQQVNAYQLAESQFLADKGVSVIVGHGPHVLEPVKRLKGSNGNETIVWYSLGNFLHAQLEAETLFNGIAVMDIDPKTGTVQTVGFLPTYMHYDWTAQQAASEDLMSRKNFELVPVEEASDLFKRSQLKTTIQAQQDRIKNTLNTFTEVKILTLSDLDI